MMNGKPLGGKSGGTSAAPADRPSDFIQSVARALRIMEVVGASGTGLTIKQIARRCRLANTTTYHLVRTLTYENYLIRGEHGIFSIGLEISDLFRDMSAMMRGPAPVRTTLRRYAAESGYSHYIARFVDGRVAITEVAEGTRSPHAEDLIIGFDDGAHATALGKALLATLTPAERRHYLRESGMRRYTGRTFTTLADLEGDLTRAAVHGVYTEICQYRDGIACAAALVNRDAPLSERMTVACAVPVDHLPRAAPELQVHLHAAARDVAAAYAAAT